MPFHCTADSFVWYFCGYWRLLPCAFLLLALCKQKQKAPCLDGQKNVLLITFLKLKNYRMSCTLGSFIFLAFTLQQWHLPPFRHYRSIPIKININRNYHHLVGDASMHPEERKSGCIYPLYHSVRMDAYPTVLSFSVTLFYNRKRSFPDNYELRIIINA